MEETTLSLPSVSRMVSVDVLDNTHALARELAAQQCEHGTLVLAYEQTAARGQNGRGWHAGRGGVYFTLLLQSEKEVRVTDGLCRRAAEAAAQALQNLFHVKAKAKRGGDIQAWDGKNKSWKKIGVARVEVFTSEDQKIWIAVGMDVNVNNRPETAADTSVKKLLGREIDPEWVLQETLEEFLMRYAQWRLSAED